MGTKRKNPIKIFYKVKCHAYLKEVNDGVHIEVFKSDGSFYRDNEVKPTRFTSNEILMAYGIDPDTKMSRELKDLSSCEGDSVKKVYRRRTKAEFKGVLVGYTPLSCEAEIGTDTGYLSDGSGYGYCFKLITSSPTVGVVYFKNNAKRYVLPEDMEYVSPPRTRRRKIETSDSENQEKESVEESQNTESNDDPDTPDWFDEII